MHTAVKSSGASTKKAFSAFGKIRKSGPAMLPSWRPRPARSAMDWILGERSPRPRGSLANRFWDPDRARGGLPTPRISYEQRSTESDWHRGGGGANDLPRAPLADPHPYRCTQGNAAHQGQLGQGRRRKECRDRAVGGAAG